VRTLRTGALLLIGLLATAGAARAQMPDVRQMSGIAMPSDDVPPGTVIVRVIRGDLSNNVTGQPVELHVGDRVVSARTDKAGRATFAGLASGVSMVATTAVGGEHLESKAIVLDASSGVRVMLVAGAAVADPPAPAATPLPSGAARVSFGGQSRIQIEFNDDEIEVFYLLDLVNPGTSPASVSNELLITLPAGAQSSAMLEGSSSQAQLRNGAVVVSGPFAPGTTPVRVGFSLAGGQSEQVLRQVFPAPLDQVQVVVSRIGSVQSSSEQFTSNTPMPGEDHSFLLGTGPGLPAGRELRITLAGLPTRSHIGRSVTLGLGFFILLVGAWASRTRRGRQSGRAGRDGSADML
jgi:hypothetical protein